MNARHRRLDGARRARFILEVVFGCGVLALIQASPSNAQFVQQGTKLVGTGAVGHARQGSGVAISADGNTAIVGGRSDDGNKGAAWVYRRVGGIWIEQAKLVGSSAIGSSQQGAGVGLSADGNTAIIGGPNDDSGTGAAWVFAYAGGWIGEAKLVGTGAVGPAQQGWSVALSGDGTTAIVGGPADDDPTTTGDYGTGAAWVYTRSAEMWSQQGSKLVGTPNTAGSTRQGVSVSLSGNGNVAIVGGPYDEPTGAAWLFNRNAGVWTGSGKLVGSGASEGSYQGQSVAVSADGLTAMVGGMYDQFDGAAWAYSYLNIIPWSQQGPKLTQPDGGGPSTWGSQGESVSLSGDGNTAVVGAGFVADLSVVGGAWVYTRSGGVWSPLGPKLVGSGAVGNSSQGWNCVLSQDGNTLIVGGLEDNQEDGAAWVFVRSLPPQNLSLHPALGGVNEVVTATILGTGIREGATVHLNRSGQSAIAGGNVSVAMDGMSVTASFDLHGAASGAWDVVVVNPYAKSTTLPGAFTVTAVEAPQLRVFAVGPPLIRANRPTAYDLVIENPGNVDALDVPLWIMGVPTDATLQLDFALTAPPIDSGEPDWSTVPLTFTSPGGRYAPIVIPSVPPGTTVRRIYLTIPASDPTFVLRAALTPPWVDGNKFRACLANGGISNPSCMGTSLTAINAFLAATPGIEALSGIGVWAKIAWQCEGANSLPAALTKAEQVLDFMEAPLEPGGTAISACSDVLPSRWRDSLLVTIVSSYDPNAKLGAQGTLPLQQAIPYSIHFENASSATAPAQQVVVSDVLNTVTLDPNTVSLDAITFGSVRIVPPPGLSSYATTVDLRPAMPLLVQVSAAVDKLTGVVSWNFTSIDPATGGVPVNPLVGFLPPNLAPPEGEGSVLFTVLPRPGLAGGTQITNGASITFDENAPNTTPTWINTVDNTPPVSQVLPLPAHSDQPSVSVGWSAAGGTTDLRDYTVYVAEDGGPYRVWRLNTAATADTLVPPRNFKPHTYAFYSVARDVSGNIEPAPTTPDATTQARTAVGDGGALELALMGARPNPAREALTVWFTLPSRDRATLDVVDIAGRRVLQREVGQLGPGSHSVTLAGAPPLRPGLYFLRLVQGPQTLSTRVAVIQ